MGKSIQRYYRSKVHFEGFVYIALVVSAILIKL